MNDRITRAAFHLMAMILVSNCALAAAQEAVDGTAQEPVEWSVYGGSYYVHLVDATDVERNTLEHFAMMATSSPESEERPSH